MLKKCRYFFEACLAFIFIVPLRFLSVDAASSIGGAFGRFIGLFHVGSQKADKNLAKIMPQLSATERKKMVRAMWDNFGRVIGEYAQLKKMWAGGYITLDGSQNPSALKPANHPRIYFAAHLANWEVLPLVAEQCGIELAAIYRAPNNFFIDALLRWLRGASKQKLFPKSGEGGIAIIRHVRANGSVGLLLDQRLGNGVMATFFGEPALSAPIAAMLHLRQNAEIIPVQIIREHGAHIKVIMHQSLTVPKTGDVTDDTLAITNAVNATMEGWIRENPTQWLWMHNRWRIIPKELLQK